MSNQQCTTCDNLQCFVKQHCSLEWQEKISQIKSVIGVRRGQQFIFEHSPANQIYFLYSGKAKVYRKIGDHNQILRWARAGDIVGHRGYGNDFNYEISVDAMADSCLCIIRNEAFFDVLRHNPELTFQLAMFYASELKDTENHLIMHGLYRVRERIIDAALRLCDVYGFVDADSATVDVEVSRSELASFANVRLETLSRTMSALNKDGLMNHRDGVLEIFDAAALRAALQDAQSANS